MPDLKEVFDGFVEKTQILSKTELASLQNEDGSYKDDALDVLLAKHAKGVTDQRTNAKKRAEDEFKRGWKENNELWDGNLKAIGVDLEGVANGEEKFERLKTHISTLTAKQTELTEDQVKNLPAFRKRETELNKLLTEKDGEWKKKWDERDAREQRERTLSVVKDKAKVILDGLKPVLSADPERARTQLSFFFKELEQNGYDVDGETIIIKDAEGKRIETDHGNAKRFDDFVKETASKMYDFQVSDQKSSAGDVTKGTKGGSAFAVKPASRKELADQLMKLSEDFAMKPDEKQAKLAELKQLEATLPG